MKSILILDANNRSALAATRSLGQKGIRVYTADETPSSLSGSSRYSYRYFQCPSAQLEDRGFIEFISEVCEHHRIDLILPTTELTLGLILHNQQLFSHVVLPVADIDAFTRLSDKCRLAELARELEIPFPDAEKRSPGPIAPGDLEARDYPIVLKPGLSWLKTDGRWIHTTVRISHNSEEAERTLREDPAFQYHDYLLQKYVPGKGAGLFALYNRGEPIAFFSHRRLREKPLDGGISVLSESAEMDPRLLEYSKKLLDHVKWHGIAMVEYRVHGDEIHLMEVNTRFWGSLQLAIDSGVDFPWLLYRIACNEKIERIDDYVRGNRLRCLIGDFKWLILMLRARDRTIGWKLKSLLGFFSPHVLVTRFELLRLADSRPFFWELRRNFSKWT